MDIALYTQPLVADLEPHQIEMVTAVRRWVMAQRVTGRCPLHAAATTLGSTERARDLHLLLAAAGAAWPDPIAIAPPCCARVTHDEATLIAMVVAARDHGRPVFDALLCEMLGPDARDALFRAAITFAFSRAE